MDSNSDEEARGWEFVREEELVERSDDESVEIINDCSSKEDDESSAEGDKVGECEVSDQLELKKCSTPGEIVVLKDELIGSSTPVSFQDVVETVVIVLAISSMWFAVTSAVMNREDITLEIGKYHINNIVLKSEISSLQKAIQELKHLKMPNYKPEGDEINEFQSSSDEPLHSFLNQVKNGDKTSAEEHINDPKNPKDPINIDNLTEEKFESPLIDIGNDFMIRGESFKNSIKTDIDYLNNHVAQSILKTSLNIKKMLYEKICKLGPYFVLNEADCQNYLPNLTSREHFKVHENTSYPVELSTNISTIIDGVAKEVAFSWMELYVNDIENKLNKIYNDVYQNINLNNEILSNVLNHTIFQINSQDVPTYETCDCKHKKKKSDKTYNKNRETNNKRYKNKKEKTEKNAMPKKAKQSQDKKNAKKQNNKYENKKLYKQLHKQKHNKGHNDENYIKRKLYFDKDKWKFVNKSGQNNKNFVYKKKEKYCPKGKPCDIGNCNFKYGCSINMTFEKKPEKNWYIDMGIHRSSKRFEGSRTEWVFDRAKGRRFMKS